MNKLGVAFLIVAATSAVLFLACLHPASGILGGIFYFLVTSWALPSWALPTVMVVSLAFGLAWLIPIPLALRIVVAFALSFVLGVNTSLPVLVDLMRCKPVVSWEVKRAINWSAESRLAVNLMQRLTVALERNPPNLHRCGAIRCRSLRPTALASF